MATVESAVQVKERPIIFGADSVRAILAGVKTQTRRVIKNPDKYEHIRDCGFCCPYGQAGEHLWLRERFMLTAFEGCRVRVEYADGVEVWRTPSTLPVSISTKWRSPMFMPRWASRISLEVTAVRVERLQEITPQDCIAEGVKPYSESGIGWRMGYMKAWDSLNAKRGFTFESNPWVWVIEFKPIAPSHRGQLGDEQTKRKMTK